METTDTKNAVVLDGTRAERDRRLEERLGEIAELLKAQIRELRVRENGGGDDRALPPCQE
jgi:hypothetical protein